MMSPAREKSIEVTAEDAAALVAASNDSTTKNNTMFSSPASSSSVASTPRHSSSSSNQRNNSGGIGNRSSSVKKQLSKLMGKTLLTTMRPTKLNHRSISAASSNSQRSVVSSSSPPPSNFSYDNYSNNDNARNINNDADNNSYNSESIGQMSVAPTVASLDTVKISNRQQQQQQNSLIQQQQQRGGGQGGPKNNNGGSNLHGSGGKKTPWKKLKQFMGLPPNNSSSSSQNNHSNSIGASSSGEDLISVSDAIVATNGTIPNIHTRRAHSKSLDLDANNNNNNNNNNTSSSINNNSNNPNVSTPEGRSSGSGGNSRRRLGSLDFPTKFISGSSSKKLQQQQQQQQQEMLNQLHQQQSMLDDAVRGRLDGMDLLYLGPAHMISLERPTTNNINNANSNSSSNRSFNVDEDNTNNTNQSSSSSSCSSTPWEPAPSYTFAGRSTQYTTKQMVTDMIHGHGHDPSIIFEGFFRDDRWVITPDGIPNGNNNNNSISNEEKQEGKQRKQQRNTTPTATVDAAAAAAADDDDDYDYHDGRHSPYGLPPLQLTDEEDHSHSSCAAAATAGGAAAAADDTIIPRHKLWGSMWGSEKKIPPKPSHMTSLEDVDPDSDSILEMAASCSVPIDVDEDTFMISNAQHLQAVHELASVPIQHGQFDEAMDIFQRILRGVQGQNDSNNNNLDATPPLRHLEGVTLHNMSVICMWQEDFERALDFAGKAVKARLQYLPEGHPDIAVSLVRQGYAYFALERFDLAEASFSAALEKLPKDNVIKAKVLLNLGVAQYQRGDDVAALKNFSHALQIQRLWLQGPVKREATVFGAAVMLGNMGKIHIKRGDYDLAVSVYEESLLLLTTIFRADHDLVLANLISLSLAWAFNSLPLKAGQILNGVLRSQLSRMGPATIPVVETTGAIGNLHFGLGNYEDALKCFAPVLKWQKANLDSEHPALCKTKDIMKQIKKSIQSVWV